MMTLNLKITLLILFVASLALTAPPRLRAADMAILEKNLIQDCAGRKIRIQKPFTSIISLYGAHTENLFFMGAGSNVIGVGKSDDFPPEAMEKPRFTTHDGPERYLSHRPDLVLVRPMIDRGYKPLIGRLEQFGVTVVSLQPSDIAEMFTYWEILGLLTGKEAAAEKMISDFKEGVSLAGELTTGLDDKKTVYFEAIHRKMKTFSPGSMPIFALTAAGGINAARDAESVRGTNIAWFGKERILSLADRIDVYLAQRGAMNNATIEMIQNEPGFSVIEAVKNQQVYLVEEAIVSRPTMRLLIGVGHIGQILYPEIFDREALEKLKRIAHEQEAQGK